MIHIAKLKNMKKLHTFLPLIPMALVFLELLC